MGRGAKPDRPGHAAITHTHPVVTHTGRQVEHIPRIQFPALLGMPFRQDHDRSVFTSRGVFTKQATHFPAAHALCLQQEHIIVVIMRSHTTAITGVTDHQIIAAPLRNEVESLQQRGNIRHPVIHGLYQQSPGGVTQLSKAFGCKRAVLKCPVPAGWIIDDQA